jgi:hypothetical protein
MSERARMFSTVLLPVLFLAAGLAMVEAQPAPGPRGEGPAAPGAEAGRPREAPADLSGRVVDVSPDGKTMTLAMPPRGGGNQPPAAETKPDEVKVTLTDRTRALFFGVGDGQAQPTPGLMAMVWLEPGSKDQAARVRFMKREGDERPDVQGRVVAVSPDGRTVTVETRDRDPQTGQEKVTGKVDVKLAPYTQTQYYAVERGGARPTVDYLAVVWFEKGSKETAARANFMRGER